MNLKNINFVGKSKNLHRYDTLEIFYYVDVDDKYCLDYGFYKTDFNLWYEIFKIHTESLEIEIYLSDIICSIDYILNIDDRFYYNITIKSKNYLLYKNINRIFYDDNLFNSIRINT